MRFLLALLLWPAFALGADFAATVNIHGLPMKCDLTLFETSQKWSADCFTEVSGKRVAGLHLEEGVYIKLANNDLQLKHLYANLQIVLRPSGQVFTLQSTNADVRSLSLLKR